MEKRFLTLDDLANMPAPTWMIEGMFEVGSLVMLAGPSYSFKSFLLMDWMLSMASGRRWINRYTLERKVAYCLGEGKSSMFKRAQAWMTYHNLNAQEQEKVKNNFRVTFEVPQLAVKSSVDNILADLEKEGFKPDVIAIDTFARSFVGLDENDAKDTGLWIEQADRLRQLGYGVIFLHHTKKNTEFGVQYRGSTAIIGAMDTAMTLVRDHDYATLSITKQKDHDEGKPIRFKKLLVGSGDDESCVLVPSEPMDTRFTEEAGAIDVIKLAQELIDNTEFPSDRARARMLANTVGMSESAAQSKISRVRKMQCDENTIEQKIDDNSSKSNLKLVKVDV